LSDAGGLGYGEGPFPVDDKLQFGAAMKAFDKLDKRLREPHSGHGAEEMSTFEAVVSFLYVEAHYDSGVRWGNVRIGSLASKDVLKDAQTVVQSATWDDPLLLGPDCMGE
jgi:hypothetical protein